MVKKTTSGESVQTIVNGILDKDAELSSEELLKAVKAIRNDAKDGNIQQARQKWRKAKGLVKSQSSGSKVRAKSPAELVLAFINHFGDAASAIKAVKAVEKIELTEDEMSALAKVESSREALEREKEKLKEMEANASSALEKLKSVPLS